MFEIGSPPVFLGIFILILFPLLLLRHFGTSRHLPALPLPPGPKRLPIIGNALDIPSSKQWLTFQQWAQEYGEIVYLELFGQSIVILNSAKATTDLLDKRSAIYSDRFKSTVVPLIGWDWNIALMGYGPKWRQTRRAFHEHFHRGVVHHYQPAQLTGARKFLTRLLANPDNFVQDLRYHLNATILEVSYGIKAEGHDDKYIAICERAVEAPVEALVLGALATEWRQEAMALKHQPFEKAMSDFRNGADVWSLANNLMKRDYESIASSFDREELAKNVAERVRILSLPIARVRGHKEASIYLRNCQGMPALGLPHRLIESDEYNGFHLPKGSIVLGNIWAISRDRDTFRNPDVFDPDRYFTDGTWESAVLDPVFAFGFGRRACPGRHFAVASIFIYAASILHVFNITPKRDSDGHFVEIKPDMSAGVVSAPTKFVCDITARSIDACSMIRSSV